MSLQGVVDRSQSRIAVMGAALPSKGTSNNNVVRINGHMSSEMQGGSLVHQMSSSDAESTKQKHVQLQQAQNVNVKGKDRQQIVAKLQQDAGMWSNHTMQCKAAPQRNALPPQLFEHNCDGKGANSDNTVLTASQSDEEWKERLKSLDMNFAGENQKTAPHRDIQESQDITSQAETRSRESLGLLLHDAFDRRQPIVKFVTPSSPADRAGMKQKHSCVHVFRHT